MDIGEGRAQESPCGGTQRLLWGREGVVSGLLKEVT